jgi:hypothetical protein
LIGGSTTKTSLICTAINIMSAAAQVKILGVEKEKDASVISSGVVDVKGDGSTASTGFLRWDFFDRQDFFDRI